MPFYYILLWARFSAQAMYLNIYTTDFLIILMIINPNVASFNLVKYVIFSKEECLQIGHTTHVIS